jgi:hypothetical protein
MLSDEGHTDRHVKKTKSGNVLQHKSFILPAFEIYVPWSFRFSYDKKIVIWQSKHIFLKIKEILSKNE